MAYVTRDHVDPGDLGTAADQNQGMDNEEALKIAAATKQITVILDGGGSPLAAGARCGLPWKGGTFTVTAWELDEVTDIASTTVIDIWRLNAAIPVVANSIVGGGTHPTLAAADRGASAPVGWTSVIIVANDVLVIYVESNDLAEKLAVTLYGTMAV